MINNNLKYLKVKDCISKVIDNRGKNPSQYYDYEKYPVIDNFLIKNTMYPNLDDVNRFLSQEQYDNFLRDYIEHKDLLITLVGNGIGNVTLAPIKKSAIVQNTIALKINRNVVLNEYLYYYFITIHNKLINLDRGSSQPSINKNDLLKLKISIQDINIQQKIADILSKYDDLIENNNKRIKLFEQMAENLYKEWFVRFRFPNYKKTKFVKGIPESWKTINLVDYINFEKGFEPGSKNYETDSNFMPFFRVADIDDKKTSTYIDKTKFEVIKELKEEDVVICFDASVGKIGYGLKGAFSSGICKLSGKNKEIFTNFFIYNVFKFEGMQAFIKNYANGATIAHAGKCIRKLKIFYNEEIIKKYNLLTKDMYEEILLLLKQNQNLIKQRDLLLPRLMSGKLEV